MTSSSRHPVCQVRLSLSRERRQILGQRVADDWCFAEVASNAVFSLPSRSNGLSIDPVREDSRQTIVAISRRAALGDARAQLVSFGPAYNSATRQRALSDVHPDLLPPDVAAAMIEAGLNAMGVNEESF